MANPYDLALRERAVAAYERRDGTYAELAALFTLDHRTLERWVARWRATGSVSAQAKGGGWRCPIALPMLHAMIDEAADATVPELCRVPRTQETTPTSFRRALRREGYVLKKRPRPSEIDRPDVATTRVAFLTWVRRIDPRRMVFVDEAGATSPWGARMRGSAAGRSTWNRGQ